MVPTDFAIDLPGQQNDAAPTDSTVLHLRRQFESFVEMAKDEGFSLTPYISPQLPVFSRHTPEIRASIVTVFDEYLAVMANVKREEQRIYRNLTTVWQMLARLRLRAASDLFAKLHENDVIEIYSSDSRQLFRSFNFFPLCTYSMEEIYSLPWFEIYERDEGIHEQQMALLQRMLGGEITSTVETPISQHVVREKVSVFRRCNIIQPRHVSPLYDTKGRLAGFLNTFQSLKTWDEGDVGRA